MSSAQDRAVAPEQSGGASDSGGGLGVLGVLAVAVAAVVAPMIVALSAASALTALGIPDPGPLTTYGLPAVRAVTELAAAIAVGSLLFAAFLTPPHTDGVLDIGGYRAVRRAATAAVVWAAGSALLVPLTLSDTTGQPLVRLLSSPRTWAALSTVAGPWRWTAVLALLLAVGCWLTLRWGPTVPLFAWSLLSLMPVALTGHSSAGGAHDVATNSLVLHVMAVSVWVGGLAALLAHAARGDAHVGISARRFSALAGCAFAVVAASGVINAWVRVAWHELFTTTYGGLVIAKTVALCLLGVFGYRQRRRAIPALLADGHDRAALIRYSGVELLTFAATIGLAVGLGRTPPPDPGHEPVADEVALGYHLAGPPTVGCILFDWRFDLIFGTLSIMFAALYLVGVQRLRARGDAWPVGRTVAWLGGCAVLLFATSSGLGRYAPALFSVHMIQHMLLSMLAPILFVLGGPVLLALRAFPPGKRDIPGPREWVLAAVHNPVSRFVTHPVVAAALFVVGFYALYLGGIFDAIVGEHAAHLAMDIHFLVSGYIFYWVVIGIDPKPRAVQPLTKVGMVFGSLPLHAFFGVALMSMSTVLGGSFYRSLGLHWHVDLLADQRTGGGLAWATGEVPLVVVMVALLVQWSRNDRRLARRLDRAADRDHDAQLAAHNAMFAELARRDGLVQPDGEVRQ